MDSRSVPFLAGLLACVVPLAAQTPAPEPAPAVAEDMTQWLQFAEEMAPRQEFSFGVRLGGRLQATFRHIGAIASDLDIGDLTSEVARTYSDGYVALDSRTDGDGNDMPDDGRTNNWSYSADAQVTADRTGISFHRYETSSDGSTVSARSGASLGIDLAGSRELFRTGREIAPGRHAFSFGVQGGIGLNTLNAKSTGEITATLLTITDTYSLLGAAVPRTDEDTAGYTAPSTTTQDVTNADGTTTSQTVDTTTYLANTPESRIESVEAGAATVGGLWQVKGAYFSLRAGPWVRWQPWERFSVRLSLGGTLNYLGVRMRYDESLTVGELTDVLTQSVESDNASFATGGVFGAFDAEWWLSERTGFFGSALYERTSRDFELYWEGRAADVRLSAGLGLRVGITTRF